MARTSGYGAIWVDLEHSSMSVDCAAQLVACAHDLGLEGWVRVPERDLATIGRLLDGGASGIIMPHVETEAEARAFAAACRFAPQGCRSQLGILPQFGFRRMPAAELVERANRATSAHVLIESAAGVANADAIAAVEGVDILHVGLNDLSASLGHLGNTRHPDLDDACRAVVAAARRHGKIAAVGGVADAAHYRQLIALGCAPLVFAAIDTDLLAGAIDGRASDWRAIFTLSDEAKA